MKKKQLHLDSGLAFLALSTLFCLPANAQSSPAQNTSQSTAQSSAQASVSIPDGIADRDELASFEQFLDGHRSVADQLRKDPSLANNPDFVKNHPELQTYLQNHPGVRDAIKSNANSFMTAEDRFARRDDNRDRDPNNMDRNRDNDRDRLSERNRDELASFDRFLDSHHEISEQVRKNPSLVDDGKFVKDHPELQTYLNDHPEVRDQLRKDPNAFVRDADRFNRFEDDRDRNNPDRDRERAGFNQFLQSHREVADQIRRDPSLANNQEFLKNHAELQAYLQQHPGVRDGLRENPNYFLQAENNGDRRDDSGDRNFERNDRNRDELANFDRFLDSHREISEQVRRDPSLLDKPEFVKDHPALQSYLQQHPGVRDQLRDNPNSFMQAEARFDHREPGMNHDNPGTGHDNFGLDMDHDAIHRHFGEFLGGHADIAAQLAKNPQLVKDHTYLESHPELKSYLDTNPDVQKQLMANPDTFIKSSQQFSTPAAKPPATTAKPHQ